MKMKHYIQFIYISLHAFSGMNLVEAYKQLNVLRNGETVSKTVQNYLFSNAFFIILSQCLFFISFTLDPM